VLHGMAFLWFLTLGLAVPAAFTPAQGLAALGIMFAAFVKGVTGMGFPVIGAPMSLRPPSVCSSDKFPIS